MLDQEYEPKPQKKRKKRLRVDPVIKLSDALKLYKEERKGVESDLVKTMEKVNLDKAILFKEKKQVLWKNEPKT